MFVDRFWTLKIRVFLWLIALQKYTNFSSLHHSDCLFFCYKTPFSTFYFCSNWARFFSITILFKRTKLATFWVDFFSIFNQFLIFIISNHNFYFFNIFAFSNPIDSYAQIIIWILWCAIFLVVSIFILASYLVATHLPSQKVQ